MVLEFAGETKADNTTQLMKRALLLCYFVYNLLSQMNPFSQLTQSKYM